MKHNIFLFTLMLSISALFASCSQNEEVYSCDKSTNQWVVDNLSMVRGMNRQQWKELPSDKKIAAYRAFSPDQKISFWEDKLCELNKLPWSTREKEHINKIGEFIHSHEYFFERERLSPEEENELELFFYKWTSFAVENLGWTKQLAYAIAGTGYSIQNTSGELNIEEPIFTKSMEKGKRPDCHCKINNPLACFPGGAGICDRADCTEVKPGCGWLLLETCDGMCDGTLIDNPVIIE